MLHKKSSFCSCCRCYPCPTLIMVDIVAIPPVKKRKSSLPSQLLRVLSITDWWYSYDPWEKFWETNGIRKKWINFLDRVFWRDCFGWEKKVFSRCWRWYESDRWVTYHANNVHSSVAQLAEHLDRVGLGTWLHEQTKKVVKNAVSIVVMKWTRDRYNKWEW